VAIYDDAAPIGELELEHTRASEFAVTFRGALVDDPRDSLQHRISQAVELARSHHHDKLTQSTGIAMRRTVGLLLVLLTLSACGTKGALYLPPPEQAPQQDSKPAPRQ